MIQDELKKKVSFAALKYIRPGTVIGVGSGSTAAYFIDALELIKNKIKGVVSSSKASSMKLKNMGIPLFDLNDINSLDVYIDSADEINNHLQMIKGGGAALTNEKIISSVARKFICIVDISKFVKLLGTNFPLPIEVIPMARTWVSSELTRLGGSPRYRQGIVTDNGNIIIDVYNLMIFNAVELEEKINNIPGVITVGLFARRCADIALISSEHEIKMIEYICK